MPWTIFDVAREKKAELDEILRDDLLSRQSQKVRDAVVYQGPEGRLFVQVEGSPEGVARAEALLGTVGTKLPGGDAERLHARFAEEDETASAGMGLFFTE
jgi:hypothetical protein